MLSSVSLEAYVEKRVEERGDSVRQIKADRHTERDRKNQKRIDRHAKIEIRREEETSRSH